MVYGYINVTIHARKALLQDFSAIINETIVSKSSVLYQKDKKSLREY